MNIRIKNSIDIIDYATKNSILIKSACKKLGFSDTYVKNTKFDLNNKKIFKQHEFDLFFEKYNKYVDYVKVVNSDNKSATKQNKSESISVKNQGVSKNIEYLAKDRIKTLDDLLRETNVDTKLWNVKEHFINKWDTTSFKDGEPIVSENFQVKVRLEKNREQVNCKTGVDTFKEMVKNYTAPVYNPNVNKLKNRNNEENLLEISIFDLHLGKLAWHGETGENYDYKIASKRFIETIVELIERSKNFNITRILFPVGNDFFNSDNLNNTTTHGTPQDEDLRWQKTFSVGVKLLVDGINTLKNMGVPVDVIVIPGNHDFERSYYMGSFLEAWFMDDHMVNVNNGASPRKYYRFGDVLLGFTHGGEEKQDALGLLMATDIESKPMWSETKFHEWHLGHQHRKKTVKYIVYDKNDVLTEDLGVTVRYLSSLTGTEEWHHKKGYIGQIKAGDGFIWNKNMGLIAHLNSNYIID